MTVPDHDDAVLRMLSRLPMATPDAARADRTRRRCHDAADRRICAARRRRDLVRLVEPVIVGGFSLIYLAAVALDLLRWHGIL